MRALIEREREKLRHRQRGFTLPLATTVYTLNGLDSAGELHVFSTDVYDLDTHTHTHTVNDCNTLGAMITIQCALYAH